MNNADHNLNETNNGDSNMNYTHTTHNGDIINLRRDGRNVYRVATTRTILIYRGRHGIDAALYIRDLFDSDFGYRYPTRARREACQA